MGVWGRGSSSGPNWSPGLLDRAETFAESDVTVTHDKTVASNEGLQLSDEQDGHDYIEDGSSSGYTEAGVVVQPDVGPLEATVTVKNQSQAGTEGVRLIDQADGTVLDDVAATEGDTVTFDTLLSAGESYALVAYNTNGNLTTSYDFQLYNGTLWTSTSGYRDGDTSGSVTNSFDNITMVQRPSSGSATIEWPMPADLAGWDIIPWEATEDGGTVEVYAVDPSDGTRLAGPLDDPGDISSLSRSTNVSVEVVLERPSANEDPRVEAVYRRRKIT